MVLASTLRKTSEGPRLARLPRPPYGPGREAENPSFLRVERVSEGLFDKYFRG